MLSSEDERFLAGLPLFRGVSPRELELAARDATVVRGRAGVPLDLDGEGGARVWVVREGLLQLSLSSELGRQMVVDVARPGDVFGGLGAAVRAPHVFHAVPLTDCAAVGLPQEDYRALLLRSPELARNVADVLGGQLAECQHMRAALGASARYRVLQVLLWLCDKLGTEIPMTREALASAAGLAKETAIRVLAPLEKKGILRTRAGVVSVRAPKRLAALALRYP